MPLKQELNSQSRKRKRGVEPAPSTEPEPEPEPQPQPPTKRQKRPHPSRSKTPPEFWDGLSRVPLCRRALREFNRRAVQPTAPKPRLERDIKDSLVKQLKRFARRGGPDLRNIRGYPEQEPQIRMSSNRARSNRSSALNSNTKPTTFSSKDAAFELELIDNGIYPYNRGPKPHNWEEIQERLAQPRSSLSPSKFSDGAFETFQLKNDEATTEAEVMSEVFPLITGKTNIFSGYNQVFNNLKPLGDHISNPQPDYFNGARTSEVRSKVRNDLEQYIVPSSQRHRPALPNFFTEAKGPDGKASEAKRQITQDLAAGARGMLMTQSYELDEPPEYHTTKIRGFDLTDNLDTHHQGITAFRNLRDLAKEKRDEFIALANERADNNDDEPEVASADTYLTSFISTSQSTQSELFTADSNHDESDSTSVDELAVPALPKKRTKARQLRRRQQKSKFKLSDIFVDEEDE
ncbi:hypothetical protein EJ08DRAFT_733991 [Tothia fuscella]|uniref:Uncharacterized protein n=1 Tax=Tothia fuscella TaxID=1048955 RepID=A0A9P4NSB4_9PEZI|nr:hypothetical protein EJ08DRAFT_733991 [Tothia fuscella]